MGEVLSQEEIDALLNTMGSGDDSDLEPEDAGIEEGIEHSEEKSVAKPQKKSSKIGVPYDFRHPNKFLKEHIENIRGIFDDLAKQWGAVLTLKHRMVVQVNLKSIDQMSYEEFLDISQLPTVSGIFQLLDGRAIIGLDRNISFVIMQNLFGGKNYEMKIQTRNLTDLENFIVSSLFEELLKHFSDAWKRVFDSKVSVESIESNLQALNIAPMNEIIIRAMMDIKMGDVTGFIVICIPFLCVQSVMDDILNLRQFVTEKQVESTREYQRILEEKIKRTQVNVHVELGQTEVPFQDFLLIKKGDIVKLAKTINDPLRIKIGGRLKFFAETSDSGKRLSVRMISQAQEND